MLGLRGTSSGKKKGSAPNRSNANPIHIAARSQTPTKTDKPTPEPTSTANITSNGKKHIDLASTISPSSKTPTAMLSPSLNGSIQVAKRHTSYTKRPNLGRATTGQAVSIGFVKDQYDFVRQRCQRELGANVGLFAFDTSYSGLSDWIKHERMTNLPHKGGSWDRVLISAHYFAAQVSRLSEAIEPFTPGCEAASNLVYGQCLLLLDVSWRLAGYSRWLSTDDNSLAMRMRQLCRRHLTCSISLA